MPVASIIKNPTARRNLDTLEKQRKERNLSASKLSKEIGVGRYTVRRYEKKEIYPSVEKYNKLAEFFGWELIPIPKHLFPSKIVKIKEEKAELKRKQEEYKKAITFIFEIGKCYVIWDTLNGFKNKKGNNPFSGTTWDEDCVFRYEGKHGIHHCFREIRGDWTRTYTDCQLIGKYIKEVNNE